MEDGAEAELHLWIGIGIQCHNGQREQAARCCLSSGRADSVHLQCRMKHMLEQILKERKEWVWFGSLLWQSLQNRTDIVLEDKK